MTKIRVLQIISGFAVEGPLGGIERFGISLCQTLNPDLFDVVLCGMWAYGTPTEAGWVERLQRDGIDAFIAADWAETAPYQSFRRALQGMRNHVQADVDIIHSHCQFGDVAAIWLKRSLAAKSLVRTVHNEREWGKRPWRRLLLTNLTYPFVFQAEMGVSQTVVTNLNNRLPARLLGRQAFRFNNAVDPGRFHQVQVDRAARLYELGIPPDSKVVGSVGRLTKQKGYAVLLNAIPSILDKLPQTHFMIIGDGELKEELNYLAKELQIEDHLTFTGPRQDVEALYRCLDLFVNSSLWEGLPTVIMESMLSNVPIVATDVSGARELIMPETTGFLVPPNQPQALADAILQALTLPDTAKKRLVQAAHAHIMQNFTIEAVTAQHEALYRQIGPNSA